MLNFSLNVLALARREGGHIVHVLSGCGLSWCRRFSCRTSWCQILHALCAALCRFDHRLQSLPGNTEAVSIPHYNTVAHARMLSMSSPMPVTAYEDGRLEACWHCNLWKGDVKVPQNLCSDIIWACYFPGVYFHVSLELLEVLKPQRDHKYWWGH